MIMLNILYDFLRENYLQVFLIVIAIVFICFVIHKIKKAIRHKREIKRDKLYKVFKEFREIFNEAFYVENQYFHLIKYYKNHYYPACVAYTDIIAFRSNNYYPEFERVKIQCIKKNKSVKIGISNYYGHFEYFPCESCRTLCFANSCSMTIRIKFQAEIYMTNCYEVFRKKGKEALLKYIKENNSVTKEENNTWKSSFSTDSNLTFYEYEEGKTRCVDYENYFFKKFEYDPSEEELRELLLNSEIRNCKLKSKKTGKTFTADIVVEKWTLYKSKSGWSAYHPTYKLRFTSDNNGRPREKD